MIKIRKLVKKSIEKSKYAQLIWIATRRGNQRVGGFVSQVGAVDGSNTIASFETKALDCVRRDGLVVLPELFPPEFCSRSKTEVDRLIRQFPDAVQRSSNNSDQRIFGAENGSDIILDFAGNEDLLESASRYLGTKAILFCTLANKIEASCENTGSGDGWHRDSLFGQYKAIVYLSDVNADNGPFTYVMGSHRLGTILQDCSIGGFSPLTNRLTNAQIDRILDVFPDRLISITGNAGTCVLADTTGIHRGAPLKDSLRYALTNYYYPEARLSRSLIDHFAPVLGYHIDPKPKRY